MPIETNFLDIKNTIDKSLFLNIIGRKEGISMWKALKKLWKTLRIVLIFILLIFPILATKPSNQIIPKTNQSSAKETIKKSTKVNELREKYQNNDIVGNIEVEETNIDEAILQSNDNEYYLTHNNYGKYDKYGSVFLDYRCNQNSKKLLIFGHSSTRKNTPFNNLENYYKKDYYEKHPNINLVIGEEMRTYQIFSVYVEPKDFTYMNLNLTDEEYIADVKKYKNNSLYETGVSVYPTDDILILQTCSNHPEYQDYKDKFLLIIAKKYKT